MKDFTQAFIGMTLLFKTFWLPGFIMYCFLRGDPDLLQAIGNFIK